MCQPMFVEFLQSLDAEFDEGFSERAIMHSGESNRGEHKIAEVCVIHSRAELLLSRLDRSELRACE